ncbi:UrvD/REP family ATP-dependent DNA helicase [Pseudoclavibacter soli]|uniref:UrvD/REP family ATP-dependent DNA helicase n=1 Tax=Pseudoclavibacter soli TaxID=452623 RepID=UPI00041C6C05|nr:UrvD/REP family ATP-dependent DNA helicase [Pseudoclavibacter soli]
MPQIRFTAPEHATACPLEALDASQLEVVRAGVERHMQVLGAPGTGKTTALVRLAAAAFSDGFAPDQVLVLAPTRQAAAQLSALIDAEVSQVSTGGVVRTLGSLAFEVLRARALELSEAPPRLLTGGEQDRLLADLLTGYASGQVAGRLPQWPEGITEEVLRLRGFRTEVRELLARTLELDVSPQRLREIARTAGRADWAAAADLFDDYFEIKAATPGLAEAFDTGELVGRAAALLQRDPHVLGQVRLVLIDDAQEHTRAVLPVLRALVSRGATLVTFGNPDQATNGFRGGQAAFAATLHHELGLDAHTVVLETSHRLHGALALACASVSDHVGVAQAGSQRAALVAAGGDSAPVGIEARAYSDGIDEVTDVASLLRSRHIDLDVPWQQMAVITRSSAGLAELSRDLAAAGVPVAVAGVAGPLRDEAVNLDLLTVVAVGLGLTPLDAATAQRLLTGFVGGLDAVGLRRVRRLLRERELRDGGQRHADELLVAALREGVPDEGRSAVSPLLRRVNRLHEVLTEVQVQGEEQAAAVDLLWSAWHAAAVADQWRQQALGSGVQAVDANRRLDAVVALFTAAQRHVERQPDASAAEFVTQQLDQRVPEDSLAHTGRRAAVHLGTPTSVIGQQFDTVVVLGLQDGLWPNTRVRNTLLGADDLVDHVCGTVDVDRRITTLHDELRLLVQALSRAQRHLRLTTIVDEDNAPSLAFRLMHQVVELVDHVPDDLGAYTLRGLVGALRRRLNGHPDDTTAAAALATLAAAEVPGAAVADWNGLAEPSTTADLTDIAGGELVRVSPSKLETFDRDPLLWFLQHVGASDRSTQAGIGTLVHAAFERAGREHLRDLGPLVEVVRARWGELDFETPWQARLQLDRATEMLQRTVDYLREAEGQGWRALEAEQGFATTFDIVEMRGSIDRIESDGQRLRIIDLKTGRRISQEDAEEHLQLRAYQVAWAEGALADLPAEQLAQAALLFVGDGPKGHALVAQSHLDGQALAEAEKQIIALAHGMAGSSFPADLGATLRGAGRPALTYIHTRGEITWPV